MESRVKFLGHPVHPMLIPFPIGLLATAFVFDVIYLVSESPRWADVAFWMMTAGIVGGLAAAVFGAMDWWAIPRHTRAYRVGLLHGAGNVAVVILFAVSWWLRYDAPLTPPGAAIVLDGLGVAAMLVTGWLGGELVDRLGVGVDEGANLDAPSSLPGPRGEAPSAHIPIQQPFPR